MIKQISSLLFLCPFLCAIVNAQNWRGLHWTNGIESLVANELTPNQVIFEAAGYYDAGYGYLFDVVKKGPDNYELKGSRSPQAMPKDKNSIAYLIIKDKNYDSEPSQLWKRKEVNGLDLLIQYQDGKLTTICEQTSSDLREYANDKIMEAIAGTYKDYDGKTYVFSTDGTCTFKGKKTTYQIHPKLDVPKFICQIDGQNYTFNLSSEGIEIYEAIVDEEGESMMGQFVAALVPDSHTPRWQFTSKYPCSSYVINLLDKEVIRLMRNEIYARHGWTFKDAKLDEYFRSCSWYQPLNDNSKVKLSELETLNVSILKNIENTK